MKTATILAAALAIGFAISTAGAVNRGNVCSQRVCAVQQVQAVHAAPVVEYAPAYQYQVGAHIREDAIADRVARLVLEKLEQAAKASPAKASPAPAGNQPQAEPLEPAANEYLQAAQAIANQRCATCHRHNGSDDNGVDLRNLEALTELQAWAAFREVYKGTMPKNGSPLDDAAVQQFMLWNVYR